MLGLIVTMFTACISISIEESLPSINETRTVNNNQTHGTVTVYIPQITGEDLIGTWRGIGPTYYTFNANGTGSTRGNAIKWSMHDEILLICITPDECGDTNCNIIEYTYRIDGDRLILTARWSGTRATYIRYIESESAQAAEITNDSLIGPWFWDQNHFVFLYFTEDGDGIRNWFGDDNLDLFEWWVDGDCLCLEMIFGSTYDSQYTNLESWTFSISGDVLRIESRQISGLVYYYNRDN